MSFRAYRWLLHQNTRHYALGTALGSVLIILTACGGGGSTSNPNPVVTGGTGSSAAQLRLGDAPADRVITFEATIGPISFTTNGGKSVPVLSQPRRLEMTHLSGISEPLVLLQIPQGTYTSAQVAVSKPEVVFMNHLGNLVKLEPTFSQSLTVNFSPAITVGSGSVVVTIDLNVANSLTFDAQGDVSGVALSASSLTFSTSAVAGENEQEAESGELEDITGTVSGVSGSSFTLILGPAGGTSLSFTTDSNTRFSEGATLATITNTIVVVEGVTRADGTLYAKEVEGIETDGGVEVEGLMTSVIGNPASALNVMIDDGTGSGMDDTKVGSSVAVDARGARYKVESGNIDTSGLGGLPTPEFPFDASSIRAGQRVEVESVSSLAGSPLVTERLKLQQQTLTGSVSGVSGTAPTTFTLTVARDSAFSLLSGTDTLTVFWQPGTDVRDLANGLKNGDKVRVRGLVFFASDGVRVIARRITP